MCVIRLLIVDDVPQVRQGLSVLLPLEAEAAGLGLEVVGEAAGGREAIEQVMALHPDVVLMDLAMPGMDGCTAARSIKSSSPAVRVVAFSVYTSPGMLQQAHDAGTDAFVEKGAPMRKLLEAICG